MARYSEKQKAVLDALMKDDVYTHAKQIINDDGIASLTMERLATDVGVSRGTLYNYFDDKDSVIDFLEERTFNPVLTAIHEIAAGELPPDAKLSRIIEWIFSSVSKDRALVIALVPSKFARGNHPCHNERKVAVLNAIISVLGEGVESGAFIEISPHLASQVFFGAITGVIDSMALSGDFFAAEEIAPTMIEIIVGGLRATA